MSRPTALTKAVRASWPDVADRVLALISGQLDPFTVPATEAWRTACYHAPKPGRPETIMHAINAVLEGYGCEAIWGQSEGLSPVAEYVNFGDTYDLTILYDYQAGRYRVTSWGDWVEQYGKRYDVQ